ncbi:MAG: YgiQ family radical SAM protein [Tannerellaceae bacterium]|jgi:uncharacterized radical SAM protein YgiQ|nr:YgiQ family radical SAM protein [Tannerellaceae bacterium]
MNPYKLNAWLPTTQREVEARGWDYLDVILFSGDAYVDHPSFGAAVIGRLLESGGLRVAVVPQPDWRGDYRDFRKLGKPRLFFGVSPGAMDSMVNHYTANKRLRSDDAYTPERRPGMRPDYPSIVYTKILKELYPDIPVVLGGIEASLRRLTHYDYWQDKLKPGILIESQADLLIYGMGEQPLRELIKRIKDGERFQNIKNIKQTAYVEEQAPTSLSINEEAIEHTVSGLPVQGMEEWRRRGDVILYSHEECLNDKLKQAKNFRYIEEESNRYEASRIIQQAGDQWIIVNPPFPPMTPGEIDASFDLPYTRLPHPKYKDKEIPAFEMIKHSVNLHRGCFGGCSFCTISAHQGKFIASRSKESILKEVKIVTDMPGFKGYLSDLGGPSANMYQMKGKDETICRKCRKPSCLFPVVCKNLHADHTPMLDIYKAVDNLPGIKKSFIGSGVRYDLLLHDYKNDIQNKSARAYIEELITRHVSGRLKVAPEHTEPDVLKIMRKPSFELFSRFRQIFERINKQNGLNQQLIPYFISSHPGCTEADMAALAVETKGLNFRLEQVQDFTPSPMTLATEIYYTGYHPYTLEKVYIARTKDEKLAQRQYFFWYKPEFRRQITHSLQRLKRNDLIKKLFGRTR